MKIIILTFLLVTTLFAQDISWKLYDDSELAVVNITTSQEAVDFMYNNPWIDSLHYATVHFKNAFIDETIDSVGLRIRGNTSRDSRKKSFKLDFEYFIDGREFYDVDKMNLNGEHNDPSIIRSKLAFDFFQEIGVRASRAAHAKIYINGAYYGLYVSIEHYDKEFLKKNFDDDNGNLWKCLWPASLKQLSDYPDNYINYLPDDYKFYSGDRQVYALKTNQEIDDYSKLSNLIDVINNTSDGGFANSLEQVMDVPSVLKYMAMNVLLGSWDDYWSNVNNFYLYHQPSNDKFYLIPYDYDNIMGIDWFDVDWATADIYNWPKINNEYRPLTDRLLANDQYHDLYSHFISFYSQNVYDLSLWDARLTGLYNQIQQAALDDSFRVKDYNFSDDDFHDSYSESYFFPNHVKRGIREFVNLRNQTIPVQLNFKNAKPNIYLVDYSPLLPSETDSIKISASVFANLGLKSVELHYLHNDNPEVHVIPFEYKPFDNSKRVEENDRWQVVMPPLGENGFAEFVIIAEDNDGQVQAYPRFEVVNISVPGAGTENIYINEMLAKNDNGLPDEAGETNDWLEFYNASETEIDLAGYYLSDKVDNLTKWTFPKNVSLIGPNGFLLVWCDEDQGQGDFHTNFKLGASGEFLALTAPDGVSVLDSFTFGQQSPDISFGRNPDGSENWQFLTPTPGASNLPTAIANETNLPDNFELTAYPNPFNSELIIKYNVPKAENITLSIFDIMGRKVWSRELKNNPIGEGTIKWSGLSQDQSTVSSGQYIINLKSEKFNQSKKVLLIK